MTKGSTTQLTDRERAAMSSWRWEIVAASGSNVVLGVWLVVSPAILGYTGSDHGTAQVGLGAAIAIVALVRTSLVRRQSWMGWLNFAAGACVLGGGLFLAHSAQATLNATFTGALVLTLAAASAMASTTANRS